MGDLSELLALRLDPELEAWRQEVREFLAAEMAPERIAGSLDPTELTGVTSAFERAHHRRAGGRGYLGISMPGDVGGGGRPHSWKAVYDFEAAFHDAPSIDTGVTLCGQVLAGHGSQRQRQELLAPMVAGAMTACIAYSEPDAGSDLGAVSTTAVPTGGGWMLDGHKTLVTGGHRADVCLTLARTDPEASSRAAFSMFWIPLPHEGVTVTRHPTVNGWTLEDLRFEGLELDGHHLVGTVGAGWAQVLGALGAERAGLAYLGWCTRRLVDLLAPAPAAPVVADLLAAHATARRFCQRALRLLDAGEPLGHTTSVAKLVATELQGRLAEAGVEMEGPAAAARGSLLGTHRFTYELAERLHSTIGAGTSEIQRDTIARLGLGLR